MVCSLHTTNCTATLVLAKNLIKNCIITKITEGLVVKSSQDIIIKKNSLGSFYPISKCLRVTSIFSFNNNTEFLIKRNGYGFSFR